ncbi:MAG: metallophosphoesterase [Bacteroidales bacterium]|nr:metallophosphoesterase [Bacteroidales bacterium]
MRRILITLLALCICGAVFCKDFNEKKVVVNLAVISDTHVNGYNTVPAYKFRSALIQERDYAARFGGLDGIVVVGDLVDSPAWDARKYTEIDDWKRLYESVFDPKEMPLAYTVGNHDVWKEWTPNTYKEAKQFTRRFGPDYYRTEVGDPRMAEEFECRHNVIGGYHILALTPNGRDPVVYPEESIRWLDEQLKAITEAEPDKYVIVITHAMIYGTVYGSFLDDTYKKHPGYWSTKALTEVLAKYPQAVTFGGHLHFPLNDPRSIWQGDFTVMGTASTRYMAIDNGGYEDMAGYTVMKDKDEYSEGLLLQFDNKGNMRAVRMDFYNQTTIGEPWVMRHPSAEPRSKYSPASRKAANKAPVLSGIECKDLGPAKDGKHRIAVSWPAGEDDEFAHTYFLTIKRYGETVAVKKVLSDFYHEPRPSLMKKTWTRTLELAPGSYEFSLRAIDSWDAESNTVSASLSF